MEQNGAGKGAILEKQPSPAVEASWAWEEASRLEPAKLDMASMSHRQQGAWAGGSGARAMQLGSELVQAKAGTP